MKTIKILHVIGIMNRGGAEVLLMELYRNIDRACIQFDFLIQGQEQGDFDDEILALGGRIFHLKKRFQRNPASYLYELFVFFRTHPEYQCVHSHMNDMSGYILLMAKLTGVKIKVAHSHTSYPKIDMLRHTVWWFGRQLITFSADIVLGCSKNAISYLSGSPPDQQKIVLKNAIDIKRFSFDGESRSLTRKEFNVDSGTFVIGNVARFEGEKNHLFILKIFQEVLSVNRNSLLVLIGSGSLLSFVQDEARRMGIDSKVRFLGVRSDVHQLLNGMDVFLMPSKFEGLGIVLVEAQANGLPCVASDVIPGEADINAGLFKSLNLDEDGKKWAEVIVHVNRADKTKDPQIAAKNAGYDIHEVATWLQSFYLNKMSNGNSQAYSIKQK
jgi:glycosyltransferase involved in cell wall biosynthesis